MSANYYYDAIDLNIQLDASSRLPLLTEEQKILNLITNYLALPYSVAEYGCGKKCSMIIHQLYTFGIPSYALKRGMMMEKDLSPEALAERDFTKRKHALTVENSFYHKADFSNPVLLNLFETHKLQVDTEKNEIQAGEFILSNQNTLQFVEARSHIFPIIYLWDEKNKCVKERVIDPTIDNEELFLVTQLRKYLHASESLIFTAPLMGEFILEEKYLTEEQRRIFYHFLKRREYEELSRFERHQLILNMNGAEKGSIGDPTVWTYANNMAVSDQRHHEYQLYNTGIGNPVRDLMNNLVVAREAYQEEEVIRLVTELQNQETRLNLREVLALDAEWSEQKLEPLKVVVNLISDHIALEELNERIKNGASLQQAIADHRGRGMNRLFGISFRLRERLESLAQTSKNKKGEIDAGALNPLYNKALVLCIKQMEKAGLKVFIDQVGNVHGLFVDDTTFSQLCKNPHKLKHLARKALCFGSHIDTVADGGKYDGRLGVISGIETANVLFDLQRFYGHSYQYPKVKNSLIVSIFTGEEMNFTGESVSMPGSSAVSGKANVNSVYQMQNHYGENYRDCLLKTLSVLKQAKGNGEIHVANHFKAEPIPEDCFDPTLFYAPKSFERHIEQGSILHRKRVPLVIVDTIMGIHQQDFHISGDRSEEAALSLNSEIRKLLLNKQFNSLRATAGVLQVDEYVDIEPLPADFGMRWTMEGMKNHAGSTLVKDRKDAGVAIARITGYFVSIVESINDEYNLQLKPIVGAPLFLPGQNRNVIPGEAAVSLGVKGANLSPEHINLITQKCKGYASGTLALDVINGGEGIVEYSMHEMTYINQAKNCSLSLDIRFPEQQLKVDFLKEISTICQKLEARYQVKIKVSIAQELDAVPLSTSGQVLQLERSYGGSHNPNEAELTRDVLRGSLLQIGVSIAYVSHPNPEKINLHHFVKQMVPMAWKKAMPKFDSGALHDTCNIATSPLLKTREEQVL